MGEKARNLASDCLSLFRKRVCVGVGILGTGTARARIESLDGRDRVERCQLEGVLDARGTVCNGWCSLRRHEQTIDHWLRTGWSSCRAANERKSGPRTEDSRFVCILGNSNRSPVCGLQFMAHLLTIYAHCSRDFGELPSQELSQKGSVLE